MRTLLSIILALGILFFAFSFLNRGDEAVLEQKSLDKEIGQMIMVGFRGTEAGSYISSVIKDAGIGGVILFDYDLPSKNFPRNITSPEQVKSLVLGLQSYSSIPLFVSVDAEGGKVLRLKKEYGFKDIPSAEQMASQNITAKEAENLAKELKELGINMNMAPVLDLNINPENPVIGALGRSFSSDPEEAVKNASAFIAKQTEQGIISVGKHFPGHGSSRDDSHLGLVDVTDAWQEQELIPYMELSLDAVMTAHIVNQNIDKDYPATLSPNFIQKILRERIGFKGVVISDDMQMQAITENYGLEEAVIRAINAGCDIILASNNSNSQYDPELPYKIKEIIKKAVKDNKISRERILEASDRIYQLKKKFGIIR